MNIAKKETTMATNEKTYTRFSASDRMEHLVLIVSFTMLGVTGLPQRYGEYELAKQFIDVLGGIESVRVMHRFFAVMLMAVSIYHGGAISYKLFVRRVRLSMIPSLKDIRDAWQYFLYNLGLHKEHPKMPRFNFGEKAEYLAVVWGTILMVITGFMLWNPVITARYVSGEVIPAARAAHSAEAFLAIAAIVIWHMYNVHIKRFNRSIFTGEISQEAMEEEHALELEEIERGYQYQPPPLEVMVRRQQAFTVYASIVTAILVGGLVYFVSLEDTAIETVPRQSFEQINDIDVTEGNASLGEIVWLEQECNLCHGDTGEGVYPVPPLAQTTSDPQAFAIAIRRGPADMPGYPVNQISDEEIAHLYVWLQSLE
jgi:formate dehydrogenase gamma subunit